MGRGQEGKSDTGDVEKLIVIEGVKISFVYIIPIACTLYILSVLFGKRYLKILRQNVIKKCVNSIAIMIVTSFVLPLLVLFLFRWLLNELFGWNMPKPQVNIRLPKGKRTDDEIGFRIEDKGEES